MKTESTGVMNCLKCGKELKQECTDNKYCPIQSKSWQDCTVDSIHPGYLSCFDMDILIIAICNNCLKQGVEHGIIIRLNQDERKRQKKWYDDMTASYRMANSI